MYLPNAPSDWFGEELNSQQPGRKGKAGILGRDRNSREESERQGFTTETWGEVGHTVWKRDNEPCGRM